MKKHAKKLLDTYNQTADRPMFNMKAVLLFLMLIFVSAPAFATGQGYGHESTYEKRLVLARQMNDIQPARTQVEKAVFEASRKLPQLDREDFQKEILGSFNFEKLEELSIKAMAEIFTVEELDAMIAYYGSAEAKSVSTKWPVYEEMMQPEIMKMLDKALIKLRTGK